MFPFWRGGHGAPHGHGRAFHRGPMGPHGPGGGVRRPLRFLIDRLDLDDAQAAALSKVFDTLRLEREQAALDGRRTQSRLADALEADAFDRGAVEAAAEARVTAATRERDAVVAAVQQVHGLLNPEQRRKLAMVIRNGPFGF
ncbi:MAG: Spy/CpxP family protein refolding chaperone [Myxococcota bacterium]